MGMDRNSLEFGQPFFFKYISILTTIRAIIKVTITGEKWLL